MKEETTTKKTYAHVVVLGSAGSYPTRERSLSSLYGITHSSKFLLDAGEGFQKAMLQKDLKIDLDWIFISHYHGDHYFGVFGYLSSQKMKNRVRPLTVYCPDREFLVKAIKALGMGYLFAPDSYELRIKTIKTEIVYYEKDLCLSFFVRDHYTVASGNSSGTYGIHLYSSSCDRYDKQKLSLLSQSQKKDLFANGVVQVRSNTLKLEEYLLSSEPRINMIYTSDGTWDSKVLERLRSVSPSNTGGLLLSECTHYFKDDYTQSRSTKHTHYLDVVKDMENNVDVSFVLTHLGSKISKSVTSKKTRLKNMKWAFDGLTIGHNNIQNRNEYYDSCADIKET